MKNHYYSNAFLLLSKIGRLCLLIFVVLLSNNLLYAQKNDFEIIAERVIKYNKETTSLQSLDKEVDNLLLLYTEGTYYLGTYYNRSVTGSYFSDLDYTSRSQASWPLTTHITRLRAMADAYTREGSKYYKDSALFDKFEKLLSFWHEANVTSTNWWQQSIGVPKPMTVALLYLEYGSERKLNQSLVNSVLYRIMTTTRTNPANEAGPNKTDMALHWLNRALIRQNSDTLKLAAKYAFDPIQPVSPSSEGIQYDGSYFQHGSQLQIASYGGELMKTTVAFLEFFDQTQFQIATDKLETFSRFARETYFGTMRGRAFPYMLTGRGVTRSGYTLRPGDAAMAKSLASSDSNHKSEYELIAKHLERTSPASEGINPVSKLYYIGDFISHNRPEYQYTIRTASSRTYRSEWGNDEGYETYFMSDGSNSILQDGEEYGNIYAVWDWAKLPGVTNPLLPRGHIPNSQSSMAAGTSTPGTQSFVGGVTDSLYSAYAYTMRDSWATNNRQGKRVSISTIADKAWFLFDEEIVCLGSGLTSNATHADLGDLELITTVNQGLFKGEILVGTRSGAVEKHGLGVNKEYDNDVQWVIHNNIGYIFPKGGQIRLETGTKSGAWSDINYSQSSDIVSEDIFALWLSHGKKAKNAEYLYFVVPNMKDAASIQQYYNTKLKDIEIVENSESIQAIRHKSLGIWQIIFRKPATFKNEELILKADQPGAIMIKNIDLQKGTADIHTADVAQSGKVLNFGIDIPSITKGLKAVTVDNTASGAYKGKSVKVLFDKNAEDYTFKQPEKPTDQPIFEYSAEATEDTFANELAGTLDTNYGSHTSMTIKNDVNAGWRRQAFIKIPLASLDKVDDLNKYDLQISIKLYLLRTNSGISSTTWVLKPVTEEWGESTVTWNNKPAFKEEILGSIAAFAYDGTLGDDFNPANMININITDYAIERYKSGEKELSLMIHNGTAGGTIDADFATKEHANEAFHPQIIIKGFDKRVLKESKESKVIMDAYVKNGGGAAVRYGEDADMFVNTGGAGYHREIYLLFGLDELKNTDLSKYEIETYMSLYQYNCQPEANKTNWDVRPVVNTDWNDSKATGINWNTRPTVTDEIIASTPGFLNNKEVSGYNEKNVAIFDITKYIQSQLAENKEKISLNIKGSASAGNSSKYVSVFAPREYKLDGINVDERTIPKLTFNLYEKKVIPQLTISTVKVKDKEYDESLFAELDIENTLLEGVNTSDDVKIDDSELILRFEDATSGENKTVIAQGIFKLTGADANKYELVQPSLEGLTATIKPVIEDVKIYINDEQLDIIDNKAYYLVDKDNTSSQLDITITGTTSSTPSSVDISKPCMHEILFSAGEVSYTLSIEKKFNFKDLVSVRWNNTLTVQNTPQTHGFEFTAFQWFENGETIPGAMHQTYSAGKNGERLSETSSYHVEVTDKVTNKTLRTWPSKVELTSAMISAYPNPVKEGQNLTISANLTTEQANGAKVSVYNTAGSYIGSYNITDNVTTVPMPTLSGAYIVTLQNNKGIIKTFTILVN